MSAPRRVRITWQGANKQTYFFAIDATVNEGHRLSATVTEHPVEKGAKLADHIRANPFELQLEGVISNTPILLPDDHTEGAREVIVQVKGAQPTVGSVIGRPVSGVGALLSKIPLPFPADTGIVKGFDPAFDRVQAIYDEMWTNHSGGIPVRVLTTLKEYEDMAIQSIDVQRNAKAGNALVFTIGFKQIRFGTTATTAVPSFAKKISVGAKAVKAVAAEPPTERSSLLFDLLG